MHKDIVTPTNSVSESALLLLRALRVHARVSFLSLAMKTTFSVEELFCVYHSLKPTIRHTALFPDSFGIQLYFFGHVSYAQLFQKHPILSITLMDFLKYHANLNTVSFFRLATIKNQGVSCKLASDFFYHSIGISMHAIFLSVHQYSQFIRMWHGFALPAFRIFRIYDIIAYEDFLT